MLDSDIPHTAILKCGQMRVSLFLSLALRHPYTKTRFLCLYLILHFGLSLWDGLPLFMLAWCQRAKLTLTKVFVHSVYSTQNAHNTLDTNFTHLIHFQCHVKLNGVWRCLVCVCVYVCVLSFPVPSCRISLQSTPYQMIQRRPVYIFIRI